MCAIVKYDVYAPTAGAHMQPVITYAKQQYILPPHKYISAAETNTFCHHREIHAGTEKYILPAQTNTSLHRKIHFASTDKYIVPANTILLNAISEVLNEVSSDNLDKQACKENKYLTTW